MFVSPSQVIFSLGGFNIYYYGVIMALAITVGVLTAEQLSIRYFNLKKDTIIDLSPYVIIFGIIFARLYYCAMDYSFYLRFPTEILAIRHGGISIHGAILGGIIGILIFSKRHKIKMLKLMDISAVGLSIGQAIGRWGNFFNSEAYGLPTDLPWKLYIAPQYRQIPYLDVEYYHPAFLYESIFDFIIFIVIIILIKKKLFINDGICAFLYLILYSIARILVELCRIDSVRYVFGIPVAIIVSAGIIIVSSFFIYLKNKEKI